MTRADDLLLATILCLACAAGAALAMAAQPAGDASKIAEFHRLTVPCSQKSVKNRLSPDLRAATQ